MKNLLYVTAFPPNKHSGGQFFSLNTIKELSKKYIIDLIYFSYKSHRCEAEKYVRNINIFNPSLLNCLRYPAGYPIFTKRFDKNILNYIKSISNSYDILYFDYTQTALYSLFIDHPNKVIRCHDVMYQKFYRQHPLLLPWIKHTEKIILQSSNRVFVPSMKDAELIAKRYGIKVQYTNEYLQDFAFPEKLSNKKSFVFFGLWSRRENLQGLTWFIENVFPLIHMELKNSFSVMGGGLPDKVRKKYLAPNNIKYLGFVEDSYDFIVQNSAMIVPLFEGAGIKVKVLDAFTTGTPVIGTEIAFEGIPEISCLKFKAETPQQFAETINTFTPLSVSKKLDLKNEFFRKYNNNHLADYL